jgi:hypothetical protein
MVEIVGVFGGFDGFMIEAMASYLFKDYHI